MRRITIVVLLIITFQNMILNATTVKYEIPLYFNTDHVSVSVNQEISEANIQGSIALNGKKVFTYPGIYYSGTVLKDRFLLLNSITEETEISIVFDLKKKEQIFTYPEKIQKFKVRFKSITLFYSEDKFVINTCSNKGRFMPLIPGEKTLEKMRNEQLYFMSGRIISKKRNYSRLIGQGFDYISYDNYLLGIKYNSEVNQTEVYIRSDNNMTKLFSVDSNSLIIQKGKFIVAVDFDGWELFDKSGNSIKKVVDASVVRTLEDMIYYRKFEKIYCYNYQMKSESEVVEELQHGEITISNFIAPGLYICNETGICIIRVNGEFYFLGQVFNKKLNTSLSYMSKIKSINRKSVSEVDLEKVEVIATMGVIDPLGFHLDYYMGEFDYFPTKEPLPFIVNY